MSNTEATGGDANCQLGTFFSCLPPFPPGGPGILLDCTLSCSSPPVVWSVDSTLEGGGGIVDPFMGQVGMNGPASTVLSGTLNVVNGGGVSLSVSSPELEGSSFDVTLVGTPGQWVWLGVGLSPTLLFDPLYLGAIVVAPPYLFQPLGMIPPSGTLALSFPLGALAPGVESAVAFGQGLSLDPSTGTAYLGEPSAILVLDSAF